MACPVLFPVPEYNYPLPPTILLSACISHNLLLHIHILMPAMHFLLLPVFLLLEIRMSSIILLLPCLLILTILHHLPYLFCLKILPLPVHLPVSPAIYVLLFVA